MEKYNVSKNKSPARAMEMLTQPRALTGVQNQKGSAYADPVGNSNTHYL